MNLLWEYLCRQRKLLVLLVLFSSIFAAVFSLYNLPLESIFYAAAFCFVVGIVLFAVSFFRFARRHQVLERLLQNVEEVDFQMPVPSGAAEADYQALVRAVANHRNRVVAESESTKKDMLDYYTLWAHQIKTPIAAMHLLLQQQDAAQVELLSAELFKIEEYVEMVLSYLRLGSEATDYVLRPCDLDAIIRSCLRKYAKLFILKKLSLQFTACHTTVITDEKWLSFVLGQLFSNAIKYTSENGIIRIYGDGNTLVVDDTGIGIRPEDLPRIFEKGFTGYNGRENQKSSGIGLYLCRQVTERLGIDLSITSRFGDGTIARLTLPLPSELVE